MDFYHQIMQQQNLTTEYVVFPPPSINQAIQMKIKALHIYKSCIDQNALVLDVAKLFDHYPDWPGVIIADHSQLFGMLSRQRCFEVLGRPFGIEVFSKKTILEFLNQYGSYNLILDANTSVQDAVKAALGREHSKIYEPIIIRMDDRTYGLLNMHTLLQGQSNLLEKLYTEVQELSIKDPLTNLSNRRGFFEAAQMIVDETHSAQSDLSALMVDIDNFKIINDVYGHFIGDQIICAVADECKKVLRQTDLLCRFGGEEYLALLPGTSLDIAKMIAERLRKKVEELSINVKGIQVLVTVSIGVCHFKDAHDSLDTLLFQADQAMYTAKTEGRNRVSVWNPKLGDHFSDEGNDLSPSREDDCQWTSKIHVSAARIYDETIEGWARALELRDKEMEGHAQRVVHWTLELARKCGIAETDLIDIRRGALLHDIGKIAVPDPILFKPGPLTEDEWVVMRRHPVYAYDILSPIKFLQNSLDIPYCHHEHWDGSGYPRGLRGDEIPLAARVFIFVDVWDALSSDRCYRPAWKADEIEKYIIDQSGKMFDPEITPIFLELLVEKSSNENRFNPVMEIADILPTPLLERKQC